MDWTFFKALLSMDSTSGQEREVADWLWQQLEAPGKQLFEVGDGTANLLLTWGTPRVVFCTHMDTVPPYIPPHFPEGMPFGGTTFASLTPAPPTADAAGPSPCPCPGVDKSPEGHSFGDAVYGRGSCDAKGQLFAMYTACKQLEAEGSTDFGLLLLSGEETGSWGAKAFAKTDFRAPYLIVGEPTENKLVSAAKGTLSYDLVFRGEPFHSGYPQYGVSAVDLFHQFYTQLKAKDFGLDPVLGETTWNVGLLQSDNPQNILSPELRCRLYFRTTFLSHEAVQAWMSGQEGGTLEVSARGGDVPARYWVPEGFDSAPVAFGSDAPHLSNFAHKSIVGPGSIRFAHRADEHILVRDLESAVDQYVRLFHSLAAN